MDAYPPEATIFADLREKWRHESDLINQRVTWLLSVQAFALTALAITAKARLDHKQACVKWVEKGTFTDCFSFNVAEILIVVSAVIVTLALRRGIDAAIAAAQALLGQMRDHQNQGRIWSHFTIESDPTATGPGLTPPQVMGKTFKWVWIAISALEVLRLLLELS